MAGAGPTTAQGVQGSRRHVRASNPGCIKEIWDAAPHPAGKVTHVNSGSSNNVLNPAQYTQKFESPFSVSKALPPSALKALLSHQGGHTQVTHLNFCRVDLTQLFYIPLQQNWRAENIFKPTKH